MQVVLLFFLASIQVTQTIEPITTSIIVGGALSAGALYQFWDDKIKVFIYFELDYSCFIKFVKEMLNIISFIE
jgi:hypothetical protein